MKVWQTRRTSQIHRLDIGRIVVAITLGLAGAPTHVEGCAFHPMTSSLAPALAGMSSADPFAKYLNASDGPLVDKNDDVKLIVGFESRSNRLTTIDAEALDRLAMTLQSRPNMLLIVLVPSSGDSTTRRFVASRLAVVQQELSKRGIVGETVKSPRSDRNDTGIVLLIVPRSMSSTPLEIRPPTLPPAPGAVGVQEQAKNVVPITPLALLPGADVEKGTKVVEIADTSSGLASTPGRASPDKVLSDVEIERNPIRSVADANVKETWVANVGQSLRTVLQEWGGRAGWTIVWLSDREYPIDASANFSGDFLKVAGQLLTGFSTATPVPSAHFYKGNRVLLVESGEGR